MNEPSAANYYYLEEMHVADRDAPRLCCAVIQAIAIHGARDTEVKLHRGE